MAKNFPLILASSLLFFLVVFVPYAQVKSASVKRSYTPRVAAELTKQEVKKPTAVINEVAINLEIADSQDKWAKGLSFRESLDQETGLLFDFGKKDSRPTFWMKDMNFPIDIIWINDNEIVGIVKNAPVPEPDTPTQILPRYVPDEPIDYVLEVNAGFTDANDINVGDTILFRNYNL